MQSTKEVMFQTNSESKEIIFKDMAQYDLVPTKKDVGEYEVEILRANCVYKITLFIHGELSGDDSCEVFNTYPFVKSFADIQTNLFKKIIWDRK